MLEKMISVSPPQKGVTPDSKIEKDFRDKSVDSKAEFEKSSQLFFSNADKDKKAFADQVWQQKVLWSFNQWFNQMGQHVKVKTHMDLLEGIK